ncbi:unnamed protein product [Paramecium primaurelia]|uniref:Uncharacterized protein n=1 Tax=Paramecium primaurelia TaxID=5886 RepID=A0A8S1PW74_PARPR|nr:unnamed protein product [Paramecium primaurelia]
MITSVCITGQQTEKQGSTQAKIPDTLLLETILILHMMIVVIKVFLLEEFLYVTLKQIKQINKTSGQLYYCLRFEYNQRELTDVQK